MSAQRIILASQLVEAVSNEAYCACVSLRNPQQMLQTHSIISVIYLGMAVHTAIVWI